MKTSQNSRLGLYILGIAMVIVFTGAVWAKGNQPVQMMEGSAMDVMAMTLTAGDMPVQNITDNF